MARERFQRDDAWRSFGRTLFAAFVSEAIGQLSTGYLKRGRGLDDQNVRRNILIWFWAVPSSEPATSDLNELLLERMRMTVPFNVAESSPTSLESAVARSRDRRVDFRRVGRRQQQTKQIDDEGLPIQFTEEIRDSVRVGALRAKEFVVLELNNLNLSFHGENGVSNQRIEESELVGRALSGLNVELRDIAQAPEEDLDVGNLSTLPVLQSVLDLPFGQLRFARVPDSLRRVIVDSAGVRYLNVNSPAIKELLRAVPEAVSNPLRRRLLEIYLGVEEYELSRVRDDLISLLNEPHLASLASAESALLLSERLELSVDRLLRELAEPAID